MREKTIFLVLALLFLIPCAAGAESEPNQLRKLLRNSLIAPYEEALPLIQRDCATGEWIVIEDRALASPRPHRAAVICEYPYLMVYQRPAYPSLSQFSPSREGGQKRNT